MAKLVFGMNQSLDGYVDHEGMRTGPELFRHWIEHVRNLSGSVYGRRMYEVMRYGTKTTLIGPRNAATSQRRGDASRNGSCRAR